MRRWFFLLLLASLQMAMAAGETGAKKTGTPANQVEMPFLVAPANQNGTLIGYHYMMYRLVTASAADAAEVRLKLAFIQDAYVRDVYKTTASRADDPLQVDRASMHDRLIAIARRIVGTKKISDLVFADIKFSPLHPPPGGGLFSPPTKAGGETSATGPKEQTPENSRAEKQKDGKP